MGDRLSMNFTEMEALASSFTAQQGTVTGLIQTLSSKVETTGWEGQTATTFREAWEGTFKPALRKLELELGNAAKSVSGTAADMSTADRRV